LPKGLRKRPSLSLCLRLASPFLWVLSLVSCEYLWSLYFHVAYRVAYRDKAHNGRAPRNLDGTLLVA